MARAATMLDRATLQRLDKPNTGLTELRRGIEKESLRVALDGKLAQTPHPPALGSPLTHPQITTDFSEAQLELITGVHARADTCLDELNNIHRFVYRGIGAELLWPSSMPCMLGDEASIPLGRYGKSNIGQAKTVYRRGLGNRYGRLMQTISGIHYNFSLPETTWLALGMPDQEQRTKAYFGLIRNFRRWSWLLIYLFGASPAVCRSFVKSRDHRLEPFDEGSLYLPHATSLRMGPLGYQSKAQGELHISYNSLAEYAASMHDALTRPYPPYAAHGVEVGGEYQQLNTAILQIENEFYGTIRPKRRIHAGERPLTALNERGVEYVEVRCLDLNPFLRVGIDAHQMRFLDAFLLVCLLADSPPDSKDESRRMARNQVKVVERGRETELALEQPAPVTLAAWAGELLEACEQVARILDRANGGDLYNYTVEQQMNKVSDPGLTPSARILETMREQGIPFFRFAMNQAIAHKGYFVNHPLRQRELAEFESAAATSVTDQQAIEEADTLDFAAFLEDYLAPPKL